VPTAAEAGLPSYEVSTWYALWALEGTPQEIVDRLVAEVGKALDSEGVKTVWTAQGASPGPLKPDEMASFVSAEIARWGKVANDAGVKIE
jgi:tripartite-type tricarboxylate transporter receptor subunit TctC